MFRFRSTQTELMDNLELNEAALISNLDEIEMTNRWFGSIRNIISALNHIYKNYDDVFGKSEVVIADLGCGSGDLLRAIAKWAAHKQIKIKLIGFDANACVLNCAVEKSHQYPNIEYHKYNILSSDFKTMQFDITTLNSFCHHLDDATLIKLLSQLQKQSNLAVIINDLHRHWLPYWSIKLISKWLNFSYLAQHDGPLSVLKAFKKKELISLAHSIKLASNESAKPNTTVPSFFIRWSWAFRWQIIMWCSVIKQGKNHDNC
jgi:2-polyprenyl-3-methyl-5-hydroxy-6-metoxy-1,4-benzoquinol methylase